MALLGDVPEPFDSVKGLVRWQEAHRRKLLQSELAIKSHTTSSLLHGQNCMFESAYDN